jgi:hypothetical protein
MPKVAVKKYANFQFEESNVGLAKDGGIINRKGSLARGFKGFYKLDFHFRAGRTNPPHQSGTPFLV